MERASELGEAFSRDARSLRNSKVLLLIGCKIVEIIGNGMAGIGISEDTIMNILNLGIALGSAVKTASLLNVDNRIMFTIGRAAMNMKLLDADIILGIPLNVSSKNIYFDRIRA
jgi:uncharacterized ferredoxin-like protein